MEITRLDHRCYRYYWHWLPWFWTRKGCFRQPRKITTCRNAHPADYGGTLRCDCSDRCQMALDMHAANTDAAIFGLFHR